jgi:hypothetical protein
MRLFYCAPWRPVRAHSHELAARIFAARLARRLYSHRGRIRMLHHAGHAAGNVVAFEVYVCGARAGTHATLTIGTEQ